MAENENRASPSSAAELDAFLAHLKAIDRDGNKRISAAEFMADIAAHLRGKERAKIPNEYAQAGDVAAAVRADIKAINDYETITARWNARDPAVTAQMWGKASEAQEAAQGRLGELLGYEPQYITTVLRENTSDLAALTTQKKNASTAQAEAAAEAASDRKERLETQSRINASVPPELRKYVEGITNIPQGDAPASTFGPAQQEIMALRKQIGAYNPENITPPTLTPETLGALDKALGTLTPQATRGNGRTGQ